MQQIFIIMNSAAQKDVLWVLDDSHIIYEGLTGNSV